MFSHSIAALYAASAASKLILRSADFPNLAIISTVSAIIGSEIITADTHVEELSLADRRRDPLCGVTVTVDAQPDVRVQAHQAITSVSAWGDHVCLGAESVHGVDNVLIFSAALDGFVALDGGGDAEQGEEGGEETHLLGFCSCVALVFTGANVEVLWVLKPVFDSIVKGGQGLWRWPWCR